VFVYDVLILFCMSRCARVCACACTCAFMCIFLSVCKIHGIYC